MNQPPNPAVVPPKRSGGCCGMGCFSLLALLLFFALALAGGVFFTMHRVSKNYLEDEPIAIPETEVTDEDVPIEHAPATPAPLSGVAQIAPAPTPVPLRPTEREWKTFEKAGKRSEEGRIELSAGQINALLQSHRNTRGKAFVTIANNIAHVQLSIPLKNVPMVSGRYLNAEMSVEASSDGDPHKARVSNIVLAKSSVSSGVLDQNFFGLGSARSYVDKWLSDQNITSFRIENNLAVGETSGANSITR